MYQGKYSSNTTPAAPRKRSRVGTIIFYGFYILLIAAIVAGFLYARNFLNDWLLRFEASQPVYKCEEVFKQLFDDPDWENIYTLSGTEDTVYEGKGATFTPPPETPEYGSMSGTMLNKEDYERMLAGERTNIGFGVNNGYFK